MEFKRIETRRIVRHHEHIKDDDEVRKVIEKLEKLNLRFSVRLKGMGVTCDSCRVISTSADGAQLFCQSPKFRAAVGFGEIESVEVECNADLIEDLDAKGRWARLMT